MTALSIEKIKRIITFTLSRPAVKYIRRLLNLSKGTDIEGTVSSIRDNAEISGANFWILFCGAIVASLGLDVNSAAVIIGAMLISPLMSPILGIGLAVGINDKSLLLYSLKNFGIAVFLSVLTSVLYFSITPLGEVTPEILARTSPTLLDVAIAFFGGVAGMVAGSRKEKTNAIPGVAVATALMPPLCTAGFGIATGNSSVLLGAFYLFFLNAVFISLSTYMVIRLLKFPVVELVDKDKQQRIHRWIIIFVLIVMLPSGVIFYSVINEVRINKTIDRFLKSNIDDGRTDIIRWETVDFDSTRLVKVFTAGSRLTEQKTIKILEDFKRLPIDNCRLNLVHLNFTEEERRQIANEAVSSVMSSLTVNQAIIENQQRRLDSLRAFVEKKKSDSLLTLQIEKELRSFVPEIVSVSIENTMPLLADSLNRPTASVFILLNSSGRLRASMQSNIKSFIEERIQARVNGIYFAPAEP